MLSAYPVKITETTLDYASILQTMNGANVDIDLSRLDDSVYVNSFLTKLANNMMSTNQITQEYLDYLGEIDEEHYYAMQLQYGGNIGNNLFQTVEFGMPNNPEQKMSFDMSLDALLDMYKGQLETAEGASEFGSFAMMFGSVESVTYELPNNQAYILSQYDVVAGEYPEATNENELVLVLNNDGSMTDLVLAQLGLISLEDVVELFQNGEAETGEATFIPFEELLSHTYTYYPNDVIYKKSNMLGMGEVWQSVSYSSAMMNPIDETLGTELKIGCILRAKEGTAYGSLASGLGYTKGFTDKYLADCRASQIVQEGVSVQNVYGYDLLKMMGGEMASALTKTEISLRELGGEEMPNVNNIYVKDFEHKDAVTSHLDRWNEEIKADSEGEQIQYTDTVAVLMTLVRSMLDAVTYVLVAFTAISLVVSSVMIGVITYVSVVERTKEIGVLRSLGARKKDIRRLFNAETFLIGLLSGIIGVGFTYLASIPINLLLGHLTGIYTLAALPIHEGIIMIVVSVLLTLISGLVPAQAAAKKDPVIALRTE